MATSCGPMRCWRALGYSSRRRTKAKRSGQLCSVTNSPVTVCAPGGDGSVTPLGGSTALTNYPAVRDSQPLSISDSGQILGAYRMASGLDAGSYYVYSNGQATPLSMAPVGFNNAGQPMGISFQVAPNGSVSPVVYNLSTGTQQSLPQLAGASQTWAAAMNGSGQVAGNSFFGNPANPASAVQGGGFLYSNGTMTNIGTLGGATATVMAMTASGQVIGTSDLTNNLINHAFLYSNGKMTDLGTLQGYKDSFAFGINAQGQVVGSAGSGSTGSGFLYSNGVMTNLNSLINPQSGWTIVAGQSINNLGQILALGYNSSVSIDGSEEEGYVLLTPSGLPAPGNPDYPTIVPEPSSLAIFGLIAAGLIFRLRPKKSPARRPTRIISRKAG